MSNERLHLLGAPAPSSLASTIGLGRTGASLCLLFVCVVWGTTYYAIKVGVQDWDPLLFTASRFTLGGTVLLVVARGRGMLPGLRWRDLGLNATAGLLLFVSGNGALVWASTTPAASGTLALQVAMIPVYTAVIAGFVAREERLRAPAWVALLVGLVGVGWMAGLQGPAAAAGGVSPHIEPGAALVLQFGCLSWAVGSLLSSRAAGTPPVAAAAIQMLAAGVVMMLAAAVTGRFSRLPPPSPAVVAWLLYLTVFGSVIGFLCFTIALRKLPVTVVSLHAHINPVVAVLVGVLFAGEPSSAPQLGAGLLIVASAAMAARHTDRRPA